MKHAQLLLLVLIAVADAKKYDAVIVAQNTKVLHMGFTYYTLLLGTD